MDREMSIRMELKAFKNYEILVSKLFFTYQVGRFIGRSCRKYIGPI